MIFEEYEIENM